MKIINLYLITINIISFFIMGFDKLLAIIKKRRISEFTLLTLSIFGGSVGAILAMIIFKHKIKKDDFYCLFH